MKPSDPTGPPARTPHRRQGAEPQLDPRLALSVLEEDQLVVTRSRRLGRRTYGPGLAVLLWGLRVYVLFMLVLVALQVIHTVRR